MSDLCYLLDMPLITLIEWNYWRSIEVLAIFKRESEAVQKKKKKAKKKKAK